ncbi:EamA family transporter [Castellaniella ginsengisoli]|uniref:DMT family transporter n=1 Tax=Castellaniella ginsengisoli TaxID=546114 RepID=A0AB39FIJ1_9BURK
MTPASAPFSLPRHLAVGILILVSAIFASNHIAARIAFDDGAGVLLGILCRAGASLLALSGIVLWRRQSLSLPMRLSAWQALLGLLIALQSFCLYSAVARIPVALALLINSVFPLLFALLTWALGGPRPSRRASLLMGLILAGLALVLDLPGLLGGGVSLSARWAAGVLLAFGSASFFACALWITEHRLASLAGTVRSLYTILIVFCAMLAAGMADVMPGGMRVPDGWAGWAALAALSLCYATGFCTLFILMPRLDMPRNAPVMNAEPVASLILGWLLLDQAFNGRQLLGGLIVLACIVILAYSRRR